MYFELGHKKISLILIIGMLIIMLGLILAYLALTTQPYKVVSQVIIDDKIESNLTIALVFYPNDIYDNKVVIAELGKNYYASLVESICVSYYASSISGVLGGNISINLYLRHPDGWVKTIVTEKAIMSSSKPYYNVPCVNLGEIIELVDYLSSQANVKTYFFDVVVEAIGALNIAYSVQTIQEKINNSLVIRVEKTKNILSISGDPYKVKDIRKTSNVYLENKVLSMNVYTARILSITLTSIGALLVIIAIIRGIRKTGSNNVAELFERKYRNIIINTKVVPVEKEKIIVLQGEEDLLRISKILGKPILKTTLDNKTVYMVSDGTFFYIIDLLGKKQ